LILAELSKARKRPFGDVFLFQSRFWTGISWCLIVPSWLNASHYRPWVSFQAEFMALLGIGLVALAWCLPRHQVQIPKLAITVAALCAIPAIHWLVGLAPFLGDALLSSGYMVAWALAIAVGSSASQAVSRIPPGVILWFPALATSLIAIMQWLDQTQWMGTFAAHISPAETPMGNMAQPNQMATLMLMGIAALWHDYEDRRIGGEVTVLGVGLLSFGMLLSQSRTGMLSGLVMAVFAVQKLSSQSIQGALTKPKHVLTWALLLLAGWPLLHRLNQDVVLGTNRAIDILNPNGRELIWTQMLYAIAESPWFGYGWNQTATAQNVGALAHPGHITYSYAHNIILDLIAWCGVPIGISLAAISAAWLLKRMHQAHSTRTLGALGALIPVAIHSLLEFPFAYAYFLVSSGLVMGWLVGSANQTNTVRSISVGRILMLPVTLLFVAMALIMCREYVLAEEDFRVVRLNNLRVGATPKDYQAPKLHVLTQLDAMLSAGRMELSPAMSDDDLGMLGDAARRYPYGALSYRYAVALGLKGRYAEASRQFDTIYAMYGPKYYSVAIDDFIKVKSKDHPDLRNIKLTAH